MHSVPPKIEPIQLGLSWTSLHSSANAVKQMRAHCKEHFKPTIGFASRSEAEDNYFTSSEDEISEILLNTQDLLTACKNMPMIANLSREDLALSCCFKSLPHSEPTELAEEKEHYNRVDRLLKEANLKRIKMTKNGDCLFRTVTFCLRKIKFNVEYLDFLSIIGVNMRDDDETIASVLRKLAVDELVTNFEKYRTFVSDLSQEEFFEKVEQYKNSGMYEGDTGDLMLPSLSNSLKLSINVIMSAPQCPFMHVQPIETPMIEVPISVAYIAYGSGHYDATEIIDKEEAPVLHGIKTRKCICGRGGNTSCITKKCECFKNKVSCGTKPCCLCQNCANRFGTRESQVSKGNGCRCGEGRKDEPKTKPCSTTKCPCRRCGQNCLATCACKFCANSKTEDTQTKKKRTVTERSIKAKSSKKLERQSSEDFLSLNDFVKKPLGWCLSESLLLSEIIKYKNLSKPFNIKKITEIYNAAILSNAELGSTKNQEQIKMKLAHLSKVCCTK